MKSPINILFNVSTRFQSSSGMTLLKNTEIYIYKLSGSNYALIKYHKFLRGSSSVVKFWFLLYKESLHIHRQKPELNHGTIEPLRNL